MGVFIMNTYIAVKNRLVFLCGEKKITINKLATESGIAPSTIKNILYGKSSNPGIVTLKKLCDGLDITIIDFFTSDLFPDLEQEIK